jgi:2TM domain-containing protein
MTQILQDRGFFIHLCAYIAVNVLLAVVNLAVSPDHLWFYWPLLGWGLGIAGHAYGVYRRLNSPVARRRPGTP